MKIRNLDHVRHKDGGYTIIQLIIVLLIIGILVVAFGYNAVGATDDAKANTSKIFLSSDMVSSIASYLSIAGEPSTGDVITDALVSRGAKPDTPWGGDPWKATASGNGDSQTIDVEYPIGAEDAETYARDIASDLDNAAKYPSIESASASSGEITVKYKTLN
jgi:type II secretory pathway pseudopilin PulG